MAHNEVKRHEEGPMEEQQQHSEQTPAPLSRVFVNMFLKLEEKAYQPGSEIRGSVGFFVPALLAARCNSFSGIHLSLEGLEIVELPDGAKEQYRFRTDCTQVKRLLSPLSAGQHEYPFCWKLPESLPCSMRCTSSGTTCQVQYDLVAYLSTDNMQPMATVNNGTQRIQIIAGNDGVCNLSSGGNIVQPKMLPVKSWLKEKGFVQLGVESEQLSNSPASSTIAVSVTGRNLSSIPVEELIVQWEETTRWRTPEGLEWKTQKVLAENTIPVYGLPSWDENSMYGSTPVSDRVTTTLELRNARVSYSGKLVEVQHSLHVYAKMLGTCVSKPKLTAVMELHDQDPNELIIPADVIAQVFPLPSTGYSNDNTLNNNDRRPSHLQRIERILPEVEVPEAVAIWNDDPVFCQVLVVQE